MKGNIRAVVVPADPKADEAMERRLPIAAEKCAKCLERENHEPRGYGEWHEWAQAKIKTHTNEQCPTCGYFTVWKKRPKAKTPAKEPKRD
jgi:DNA-directed RNA polymerase subunit RPC12/RpoP